MMHGRQALANELVSARAGTIEQPDDGQFVPLGQFDHAAFLVEIINAERATQNREILGDHRRRPPFDLAKPGDNAIGRGVLIGNGGDRGMDMGRQLAQLFQGIAIEQQIGPLPCRKLALIMLARHAFLATQFQAGRAALP